MFLGALRQGLPAGNGTCGDPRRVGSWLRWGFGRGRPLQVEAGLEQMGTGENSVVRGGRGETVHEGT